MEVAERVRSERQGLNWSKRKLAREAGVSVDLVQRLEAGQKVWPMKLMAINAALLYGYGTRHK